jgi:cytoskeleton protein RodZ
LARALTLDRVAAAVRIPVEHLAALEEDRIDALPGRPFAIGFARTYATYLGVDHAAVAARVGRIAMGVHREPELRVHEAAAESRFPGSALVAASVIAAIVAYGFWYYDAAQQHVRRDLVQPVPPQMLAGLDSVHVAGDGVPKPKAPPGEVASLLAVPSLPPLGAGDLAQAPVAILPDRTFLRPGEANAAAPLQPPERPAKGRIQLRAVHDAWIEVRNIETGQVVANQILRTGNTLTPPAGGNYKLTTGNAGGLEIAVDGAPIPTLGNAGAVIRDIPLDADRLKAGYTPPPRR